ncbi:MAG: DUF4020 domain-containing protein [Limisphaerales bacterium]
MFFDPIEIPDALLEAQEEGKLVVFAGAGVSMGEPSNLPSFKRMAAVIAGSHPLAAEIDKYEGRWDRFLGELSRKKVEVERLCRTIIADPKSKPTELHRSLVGLFIKPEHLRIVTTNFDLHFRSVLDEIGLQRDNYSAPALPLGNQFCGLVHLHGCISRPEPLVLTDENFGRAYLTEGWAREFLQRLFAEFTTLFVGYSHNDLPVEYLARGMSGKSIAPRFALTAAGEGALWASLGIQDICFEMASGNNRFANLCLAVKRWAAFTGKQPTDLAQSVREIVSASDILAPDKSQASLIRRCVLREGLCRSFTNHAKGWRWVKWLQEQGLLAPLFDPLRRECSTAQQDLAFWLARELLSEPTDRGLLLVEKHDGGIGEYLWTRLCRRLCGDGVDWGKPAIRKWVLVLVDARHRASFSEFSALLFRAARETPDTLGMTLLRRFTSLRIVLNREWDVNPLLGSHNTTESEDKAELEIALAGELHDLDTVWDSLLRPRLTRLREPLLLLLENRLREAHEMFVATGRSDTTDDPLCSRNMIVQRDLYRTVSSVSIVVDLFLDVLEEIAKQAGTLPEHRIVGWITTGVPVLVRLALHALYLSKDIPKPRKMRLILDHQLVYPAVLNADSETWKIIGDCYSSLASEDKTSLWDAINQGPSRDLPADANAASWAKSQQWQINRLTYWLARNNPACPEATQAKQKLRERQPSCQNEDFTNEACVSSDSDFTGTLSPKSATDLLKATPESQVEYLLDYRGGEPPFKPSRDGLLIAVGVACADDHAWCLALLKTLDSRQEWASDLWEAALLRVSIFKLPPDRIDWLLDVFRTNFAESPNLQRMTPFLFRGVDLSQGKGPSQDRLERMIALSLLIWKQIKGKEPAAKLPYQKEDWANRATNHPAGHIVDFWLRCCAVRERESGGASAGFPEWMKPPLAEMIVGADLASQLGRATLGLKLSFLYQLEPTWVRKELFPKFQFSSIGEEAFLLWEPHARYGKLSRDLILTMPAIYRDAFGHVLEMEHHLRTGFIKHMAAIVLSCLTDVNDGDWLFEFLLKIGDQQRGSWAQQIGHGLLDAPDPRKAQVWQGWMRGYWENRLGGKPCPLSPKEGEAMLEWAFAVGQAFPEAVGFVVQGPRPERKLGMIVRRFARCDIPKRYPKETLNVLDWLCDDIHSYGLLSGTIEEVINELPRLKAFLPLLGSICNKLVRLGYVGAGELKRRCDQEFVE